ncbi:hypothetical protein KIL84_000400 [Mauremys mutica]|uniref:Uncharacterized protein n=1 Tax=Mauremys mutica TaxID=74926 RepID=A0A9D4B3D4_9SAUR|nr:hypothetical protein KIL84_000400 [Mauremys mutica]
MTPSRHRTMRAGRNRGKINSLFPLVQAGRGRYSRVNSQREVTLSSKAAGSQILSLGIQISRGRSAAPSHSSCAVHRGLGNRVSVLPAVGRIQQGDGILLHPPS